MKLALGFLAALTLTHATIDTNSIKLNHRIRLLPPFIKNSLRIFGGQEVPSHSLPYQVFLNIYENRQIHNCGGSIVSSTTVLTAAHCVENSTEIVVIFGQHDLTNPSVTQLQVYQVIIHPGYNKEGIENDIAILRFNRQIEFNAHVQMVRLPSRAEISYDFAGEMATASGWGFTSNGLKQSPVLLSIDAAVMSNHECNNFWGGIVTPTLICISPADGKSTCQGDSGGPLVANGKLIGIISFGSGYACGSGQPSVLTRVTAFLDWIAQNSDVYID